MLAVRIGALLTDPAERRSVAEAGRETVAKLSGALERTLAALDPYLIDIRRRQDGHA